MSQDIMFSSTRLSLSAAGVLRTVPAFDITLSAVLLIWCVRPSSCLGVYVCAD